MRNKKGEYMENIGIVTQVTGKIAKVRVDRESACGGNCVSCKGCPGSAVIIETENTNNFYVGEKVRLTIDNKEFLKSAIIGYGIMAILMVAFAIGGYMLLHNESMSIVSAFVGLVIGFFILKIMYRGQKEKYIIEKIMNENDLEE